MDNQKYPGRTREAGMALKTFMSLTGQEDGDFEQGLEDLITDLLHLANERELNVLHSLQRATLVFCDEASEKETEE